MMRITHLTSDDYEAWAELLAAAFARQPSEMVQLLTFLQSAAPLIAYGAWDGAQLAAQYSCLLRHVHVPGQPLPITVGVSLNMAVHPDYRGRGLVKQVAQPVYTAVHNQGGTAGVGFSNAAGVQVDRHSKGYGYQVVGRLDSVVGVWQRPLSAPPLTLTTCWPDSLPCFSSACPIKHHFISSSAWLAHRFAQHPFRQYHFGVGEAGVVVYRPFHWHGWRGVSLLAAHGPDLAALLRHFSAALWPQGIRMVHLLTSPQSSLLKGLRQTAVCLRLPYSRSPYYLTAKPLCTQTAASLFNFNQWDCIGGDIL
ncbi:MAG: GNAT family N-acetyltransferase [Ardenticatenaceae bacterium]|nr:GNAT family N-acetyltransferase [Ardenticatenaceae bacterium]